MNIESPHARPDELAEAIYKLNKLMVKLGRNCCTCLNFDDKSDMCKLFNARPPAKVILHGCEKWDGIPF